MSSPSSECTSSGRVVWTPASALLTRGSPARSTGAEDLRPSAAAGQKPGQAFSKQELMTALWPDTFVEDANLSFQISTLRKALGDGASAWIETFRSTVSICGGRRREPGDGADAGGIADWGASPTRRSRRPRRAPASETYHGVVVGLTILAAGYLALVYSRPPKPLASSNSIATPLTAYPGAETGPSLSPDGNQVAFSWNGPREDNPDVYVKLVGVGEACAADDGARTRRKPGMVAGRSADCVRAAHPRANLRGPGDAGPGRRGTASGLVRPRQFTQADQALVEPGREVDRNRGQAVGFGAIRALAGRDRWEPKRGASPLRRVPAGWRTWLPSSRPTGAASHSSEARRP